MPTAEELRLQLQQLQAALKEQERIEEEERKRKELEERLIVKIDTFNSTRKVFVVYCSNPLRQDFRDFIYNFYSCRWLEYVKMYELSLNDYREFHERASKNERFDYQSSPAQEKLLQYLNTPDVKVDFNESLFIINLKEFETLRSNIFGNSLNSIVKYHTVQKYFSLPYNEGGKLLTRLNELEGRYTVEWEPLAIEAATEELENRNKINSIAALTFNPDYDLDLNGYKLHPFQTVGSGFLDYSLYTLDNPGAMCQDEMGLGKSPQALAVAYKRKLRTLILTPAAGRDNWFDYVRKFCGKDTQIKVFQKTEPDKFDFEDMLLHKVQWNIMAYDTIARGKPMLDKHGEPEQIYNDLTGQYEDNIKYLWADLINLSNFDLIIADECHKLKNDEAGRTIAFLKLKPKKLIGLSGTPILNRPAEYQPILSKCDPKNFSNKSMFLYRYTDGKNGAKNQAELRELIKPIAIRRKKSEVLKDLPPVIPMNEYYIMKPREKRLYEKVLNQVLDSIDDNESEGFNFFASNFLVKIMRLKQVCSLMVSNAVAEFAFDAYHNSESEHKKVIIFSQFVPIVRKMAALLGNESLYITGEDHTPSDRLRIVKEFQSDPHYKYLVASTSAASEQLNITAAGTVIFADLMWTPSAHDQAIGRAYGRLNDCHGVDVHYFIIKETIMEWIVGLLNEKSTTIGTVVDGIEAERAQNTSVLQDLIKMLRGMKKGKGKK